MLNAFYMLGAMICVLLPLVALHELGHYVMARLCGVKVLTYSIGFGPKLFGFVSKKSGIDYRISAIPLGGYVKMLDEREGDVPDNQKKLAFNNAHPLKKIAIVLAGPVMNFLIAIGLFCAIFMMPKEQLAPKISSVLPDTPAFVSGLKVKDKIVAVDDKAVDDWQGIFYALADRAGESGQVAISVQNELGVVKHHLPIDKFLQDSQSTQNPLDILGIRGWQPTIAPIIGQVAQGGSADLMGLKVGDKIVKIYPKPSEKPTNQSAEQFTKPANQTPQNAVLIHTWQDISPIIQKNPESMLVFEIIRNNETLLVDVMPQAKKVGNQIIGQIGVQAKTTDISVPDEFKMTAQDSFGVALKKSFVKTYDLSVMTLKSIGKMLSGLIGLDNLSGPISIAEVSKNSIEMGLLTLLSTTALISVSLAVMNLLPIPVLDGGHMVYALYELIAGKPLSERIQMVGLNIGMLMMLSLMLVAISNDILRVFG